MGYRLGVDLGTTFTAAAIDEGAGPVMVGLGNRAMQVPSVLFLKSDGHFLFGEAAERRAASEADRVAREFKRRLGDTVPVLLAGQPYSPQSLTARLLAWVVATVSERQGSAPDEVVLTFPANWGGYKRELLDQIISLADLPRTVTCTEPVAAATQYATRARLSTGDRLAVYDLGGGTFDVCVLEKQASGFAILGSPDGVEHLGGIDFDEAVFRHVLGQLLEANTDLDLMDEALTSALSLLRRNCVEAKEALSSDVEAAITVPLPGLPTSVRLTRAELETLIAPALGETLAATRRALRSAETAVDDLAGVVLVGGSSRIPLVSQLLQGELRVRTAVDSHPKHDIALGAAQYRRAPAVDGQSPWVSPPSRLTSDEDRRPNGESAKSLIAETVILSEASDGEPQKPTTVGGSSAEAMPPKSLARHPGPLSSRIMPRWRATSLAVVLAGCLLAVAIGIGLMLTTGSGASRDSADADRSQDASVSDPATAQLELTRVSYDGDSYSDLAIQSVRGPGEIVTMLSDGKNHFSDPAVWAHVDNSVDIELIHRLNGDFDGDGRTDAAILQSTEGGMRVRVRRSEDDKFIEARPWGDIPDASADEIVPISGDFDGDNAMDILTITPSARGMNLDVLTTRGSELESFNDLQHWHLDMPWGYGPEGSKVLGGDFNADGRTDLVALVQKADGLDIEVALSTLSESGGQFASPAWITDTDETVLSDVKPLTGDFNGDGRTDLILYAKGAEGGTRATFYTFDKSGFSKPKPWWSDLEWDIDDSWVSVGDFNGDGKSDVARIADSESADDGVKVFVLRSTGSSLQYDGVWGGWDGFGYSDVRTLNRVG